MAIYIQKIEIRWTKTERGNPGATFRAQVPEKLPVGKPICSGAVLLQEISFSGKEYREAFRKELKSLNENQIREAQFSFTEEADECKIEFWNENAIKKKIGNLKYNSWCQLKTNRRYSLESTWGYYKIVYNIFYGDLIQLESSMNTQEKLFMKDFQTLLK